MKTLLQKCLKCSNIDINTKRVLASVHDGTITLQISLICMNLNCIITLFLILMFILLKIRDITNARFAHAIYLFIFYYTVLYLFKFLCIQF